MAQVDDAPSTPWAGAAPERKHSPPNNAAPPPAPEPAPSRSWDSPPGEASIRTRQVSAVFLVVFLYTAAVPFTPLVWLLDAEGAAFFDRLLAGILLLSACYFQWEIAGLRRPLAVVAPGSGATVIRNGRVERADAAGFVWHPSNYWPYVICEAMLLGLAEYGPSELLRRTIVTGVIAGLWAVGFSATPESTKKWAYDTIKKWMFWMVLSELMNVGGRSMAGSARRRRY